MSTFQVNNPSAETTVIAFGEEVLGGAEALELTSLVREACAGEGAVVVFDLERVRVMNSSGLGMLVGALATVRKQAPTPHVVEPMSSTAPLQSSSALLQVSPMGLPGVQLWGRR